MLFKQILLITGLFFTTLLFGQEKFTISGVISDKKNSETLIGVNVAVGSAKVFTSTNEYGFYSITLPKGIYELTVTYIGYSSFSETIELNQTIKKNISLFENGGQELEEVVVANEKTKINTRSSEMSVNKSTSPKTAGIFFIALIDNLLTLISEERVFILVFSFATTTSSSS